MSKLITENDLKGIFDEILPSTQVDYVVEQGTDGDWTYRKWNSGIAECWCRTTKTISCTANYFGGYWGNVTVDFPTGLFNAVPTITVGGTTNNYGVYAVANEGSTKDHASIYAWNRTSNTTVTNPMSIQAIGTWK